MSHDLQTPSPAPDTSTTSTTPLRSNSNTISSSQLFSDVHRTTASSSSRWGVLHSISYSSSGAPAPTTSTFPPSPTSSVDSRPQIVKSDSPAPRSSLVCTLCGEPLLNHADKSIHDPNLTPRRGEVEHCHSQTLGFKVASTSMLLCRKVLAKPDLEDRFALSDEPAPSFVEDWWHWQCVPSFVLKEIGRTDVLKGFGALKPTDQFRVRRALLRGEVEEHGSIQPDDQPRKAAGPVGGSNLILPPPVPGSISDYEATNDIGGIGAQSDDESETEAGCPVALAAKAAAAAHNSTHPRAKATLAKESSGEKEHDETRDSSVTSTPLRRSSRRTGSKSYRESEEDDLDDVLGDDEGLGGKRPRTSAETHVPAPVVAPVASANPEEPVRRRRGRPPKSATTCDSSVKGTTQQKARIARHHQHAVGVAAGATAGNSGSPCTGTPTVAPAFFRAAAGWVIDRLGDGTGQVPATTPTDTPLKRKRGRPRKVRPEEIEAKEKMPDVKVESGLVQDNVEDSPAASAKRRRAAAATFSVQKSPSDEKAVLQNAFTVDAKSFKHEDISTPIPVKGIIDVKIPSKHHASLSTPGHVTTALTASMPPPSPSKLPAVGVGGCNAGGKNTSPTPTAIPGGDRKGKRQLSDDAEAEYVPPKLVRARTRTFVPPQLTRVPSVTADFGKAFVPPQIQRVASVTAEAGRAWGVRRLIPSDDSNAAPAGPTRGGDVSGSTGSAVKMEHEATKADGKFSTAPLTSDNGKIGGVPSSAGKAKSASLPRVPSASAAPRKSAAAKESNANGRKSFPLGSPLVQGPHAQPLPLAHTQSISPLQPRKNSWFQPIVINVPQGPIPSAPTSQQGSIHVSQRSRAILSQLANLSGQPPPPPSPFPLGHGQHSSSASGGLVGEKEAPSIAPVVQNTPANGRANIRRHSSFEPASSTISNSASGAHRETAPPPTYRGSPSVTSVAPVSVTPASVTHASVAPASPAAPTPDPAASGFAASGPSELPNVAPVPWRVQVDREGGVVVVLDDDPAVDDDGGGGDGDNQHSVGVSGGTAGAAVVADGDAQVSVPVESAMLSSQSSAGLPEDDEFSGDEEQ
ncbi:hypothetical protein DFJ73DRAFT_959557 [Zopfochytrium polystomum]|nr:hypothetical protein DFJ73DRAFT_959557 [Zopfochytrium polystomum]